MRRSILFDYVVVKITFPLLFFIALFLILGELVGITFEQMRLIVADKISVTTSIYIHVLSVPKFLLMTMPYALFTANIFTYSRLSASSELVALCSFGISIKKILMPCFILSIVMASAAFCFGELVVTEFNYKAATTLEQSVGIDRDITINDFVYNQIDNITQGKEISLLLYAQTANDKMMKDVTLLSFESGNLHKIIIAPFAFWSSEEKIWKLYQGTEEIIDKFNRVLSSSFNAYELKARDTLNQLLTHTRDDNELSILNLRKRLKIFRETGHEKEALQLEKSIHDRFIVPASCIVFSLIGASIGTCVEPKSRSNRIGLGLIVILIYYVLQFMTATLTGNGSIPIWGIWLPSLLGLVFILSRLLRFH